MSKINIKTDFQDGDKLFAADLNNNFRTIQAGVNANEENLEEIIEQAIVRLDNELIAITANRGWDWNGGDRVTFYKGNTDDIEARDIINGQMLYNTETGETYLDDNSDRIVTGSGNVVAITETEPENPATKLWINPDEQLNNIGTEVVNSMAGNQTNMAPSVSAVKDYVEDVYSTDEVKTNKVWIDGKSIYRKVVNAGEITTDNVSLTFTVLNNVENIVSTFAYIRTPNHSRVLPITNGNAALRISWDLDKQTNTLYLDTERDATVPYEDVPIYCIVEYTKTTD